MKTPLNRLLLIPGTILVVVAFVSLLYQRSRPGEPETVVRGLQTLSEQDILGIVNFLARQSVPPKVSAIKPEELKEMLSLHPRIKSATVTRQKAKLFIEIVEKEPGYLVHRPPYLMEVSPDHEIVQERITQKMEITPEIPIFYLTAEKDNEVSLIKRDIIQLWTRTRELYAGLWEKISEIKIRRANAGQIEIVFYLTEQPVSIIVYDKFGPDEMAKLWAVIAYVEEDNKTDSDAAKSRSKPKKLIKIFGDHAIVL